MIKGIDKRDHEHLLRCLEELCTLTLDADEAHLIRTNINTLTSIYERYNDLLQAIAKESGSYHALYKEVQVGTYKRLRKLKMKRKTALQPSQKGRLRTKPR